MPAYDFECLECGYTFQEMWSVSEYEKKKGEGLHCPKCKSEKVEQVVRPAAVETSKKS